MKEDAEKKAAEEAAKVKAAADAEAKVSLRHNKMIMEAKMGFIQINQIYRPLTWKQLLDRN